MTRLLKLFASLFPACPASGSSLGRHGALVVVTMVVLAGCGRSDLLSYVQVDGGAPDGTPPKHCTSGSDEGCGSGQACCDDLCVDIEGSSAHCGSCANVCPSNETCDEGSCLLESCNGAAPCGTAQSCCGQGCTNTDSDIDNCGGCGNACEQVPGGFTQCVGGQCVTSSQGCGPGPACTGDQSCCPTGCTDENTDPNNCSACGFTCGAGDTCVSGNCEGPSSCNGGLPCSGLDQCCGSGCTDIDTDPDNCGGCGNACPASFTCVAGGCTAPVSCDGGPACTGTLQCCGSGCTDVDSDPGNCGGCDKACPPGSTCEAGVCTSNVSCDGGPPCNGGETCCDEGCTDISSDPSNCGGCNTICAFGEACMNGFCTPSSTCGEGPPCLGPEQCCDDTCTDTTSDPNNCGGCGLVCATGDTCVNSTCKSPATCNGGPVCIGLEQCCPSGCTDVNTDPDNCAGCGNTCKPGDTCVTGVCTAPASCQGGPVCTGSQQCCQTGCTDVDTDPTNCGMCGNACPTGDSCAGGTCQPPTCGVCATGELCCNLVCTDTTSSPMNCGACGHACLGGQTCTASQCVTPTMCNGGPACPTGDTCCPSGCIDTTSDPANCGGCGVVCGGSDMCIDSTCTNTEGAFNPTVNPTYLSPGVHSYSSIDIPAGITVYVAGQGANSGTLSLNSTGPVTIAGTIDLSGGPGTQNTITSQNTEAGEAGGGGFTGEPYESAPFSAACSFVAGNGGSLGDAVTGTAGTCTVASTTTCLNMNQNESLLFAAPPATYGGGGGIFTGYRAYGAGGGGPAGGAPGGLGAAYPGEQDCSGASGGGGATGGQGGAGSGSYKGSAGTIGQTQCAGLGAGVPPAYVGGGGGGGIGSAAIADLAVANTFQTGSAGGGGSADYLNRPVFGGTSGGGGGGGALKISSAVSIAITGKVLANGGPGGDAVIGIGSDAMCNPQPGAAGGGGSGGIIYLAAPALTVSAGATVSAAGGPGGAGSEFATGGAGGKGGLGRLRLSISPGTCAGLLGSFAPPVPAGCPAGTATAGSAYVGTYPN